MISHVVFDFDGTLVDSNAVKRDGFLQAVSTDPGGRARMMRVLERVDGDRAAVFAAYAAETRRSTIDSVQDVGALVQIYSQRVDALVASALEMPGATRLLERLQRHGLRLFLSSGTPIDRLREILRMRSWMSIFAGVYGYPMNKRESLRKIRETAGVQFESIAVVGDGEDDRDSALSLGCPYFPVGEARGAEAGDRVYVLDELFEVLHCQGPLFSDAS